MECVLSHYPSETHFELVTRIFNHEAKTLYKERLNFTLIHETEIRELGYDERYCGFKHKTSIEEIRLINENKIIDLEQLSEAPQNLAL